MASDDAGESKDVTALHAAGDESRMRIVQALVEHRSEQPRDPGLPFSALRKASGIRDSGRFNYHLDKLRDRFVEENDGEYELTYAGRKLGIALVSGTYRSGISKEPTAFGTCPRKNCDATLIARYENGNVVAECGNDHPAFRTGLPPGAAADRSIDEIFAVVIRTMFSDLETAQEGICLYCYATVDPVVEFDEFHGESDYQFQQFRGGAPGLQERGLSTCRKRETSRPGRTAWSEAPRAVRAGKARAQKPTLDETNHETVAFPLPNH